MYSLTDEDVPLYNCDTDNTLPYDTYKSDKHENDMELSKVIEVGNNFEKISISIIAKGNYKAINNSWNLD